jgi:hypothetical protein
MRMHQVIYHAKKIDIRNADLTQYESPTQILTHPNYFTIEKASSSGGLAIMQFGSQVNSVWNAVANSLFFKDKFKVGDLFWIEGEEPIESLEEELGIGSTANAVVTNVTDQGRTIVLTLSINKEQVNA